jgi:hypothetical protein
MVEKHRIIQLQTFEHLNQERQNKEFSEIKCIQISDVCIVYVRKFCVCTVYVRIFENGNLLNENVILMLKENVSFLCI